MVCVLKLVTHLVKANKFVVKVKGFTEGSREKLAEAPATFVSVDTASVTMGELGHCKGAHEVVPKLSKEFKDVDVNEGEEVLTLHPEERGTHKKCSEQIRLPRQNGSRR